MGLFFVKAFLIGCVVVFPTSYACERARNKQILTIATVLKLASYGVCVASTIGFIIVI